MIPGLEMLDCPTDNISGVFRISKRGGANFRWPLVGGGETKLSKFFYGDFFCQTTVYDGPIPLPPIRHWTIYMTFCILQYFEHDSLPSAGAMVPISVVSKILNFLFIVRSNKDSTDCLKMKLS